MTAESDPETYICNSVLFLFYENIYCECITTYLIVSSILHGILVLKIMLSVLTEIYQSH